MRFSLVSSSGFAGPRLGLFSLALALVGCNDDKATTDSGSSSDDTSAAVDEDGDGYTTDDDCDDTDAQINPGVEEICDGVDNDCDDEMDEGVTSTWYPDEDGDGFGEDGAGVEACEQTDGYVGVDGDCDDTDTAYYPGAPEDDCTDANDYNCDGSVGFVDADRDGVAACEDCDDSDPRVNPDGVEVCDGIDNDCDSLVDDADDSLDPREGGDWYADTDDDGYGDPDTLVGSCEAPAGYVADSTDCDDGVYSTNPAGTEVCDDVDNDCDGAVDDSPVDGDTYYPDSDGDGYGDPDGADTSCDLEAGWVTDKTDCDDTDGDVSPAGSEVCNGIDDDCDRAIDDSDRSLDTSTTTAWYADEDGDAFGDADNTTNACEAPAGYGSDSNDCDDTDADVNPSETEICNGIDDDCDSRIDTADSSLDTSSAGTWYADDDRDGYGDASDKKTSCEAPSGYVADATDCDDAAVGVNPGEDETCNSIDDDCDGTVDNDPVDGDWYPEDEDGDGFGAAGTSAWACDGVSNDWDCDDSFSGEPQVVDASASATGADGTLSKPWDTVQEGIDEADLCVVVFGGTYEEAIDFSGKSVRVMGVEGPENTILDATGLDGAVVTIASGETADALLSGFTLTGGTGDEQIRSDDYSCGSGETCTNTYQNYCGGGVFVLGADPTLADLIIVDNSLPAASSTTSGSETITVDSFGGGVCFIDSTATLIGVTIRENYAAQGGGLYLDESSNITHMGSAVLANTATDGAGYAVDGGVLTLTNVLSAYNEGDSGGGVLVADGTFTATNLTFGYDDAADGAALYTSGTGTATVLNSIFYGAVSGAAVLADSTATFTGTYNNVYSNASDYSGTTDVTGTGGNISGNPRFTSVTNDGNPDNDDWSLKSTSASKNTGDPAAAYYDTDGSRNDQGAYGGPGGAW